MCIYIVVYTLHICVVVCRYRNLHTHIYQHIYIYISYIYMYLHLHRMKGFLNFWQHKEIKLTYHDRDM